MRLNYLFERKVFFGDCDLLGIAFTGRIPNFVLEAIESFWEEVLSGDGWLFLLREKNIAMPFVSMNLEFQTPVRAGIDLVCEVQVVHVGESSVGLKTIARQGSLQCFSCETMSVFRDASTFEKVKISSPIRQRLYSPDHEILVK
jgi:acyl-CoA thioesterase FadM